VQKRTGIVRNEKLLHRIHSFCSDKKEGERRGCLHEKRREVRKRRAESHLTAPSTSHSKHLASIAAVIYEDDNGASERSERAKLDMPASRIGWCILPILESGMSSLTQ